MRSYVCTTRPKRDFLKINRAPRHAVLSRPMARGGAIMRAARNTAGQSYTAPGPDPAFQIDPYLDYGRFLTPEGGILIIYKDIDLSWRHTFWRLLTWIGFTGLEANYLFNATPQLNQWKAVGILLLAALANWLIVAKPVELYRRIEIRPDCMIIDGADTFWARFMEGGLPSCRPGDDGHLIFCGIYGTRFVEFLTIRRFDEHDRMPEVMAAHLQDAMRQLWMVPH